MLLVTTRSQTAGIGYFGNGPRSLTAGQVGRKLDEPEHFAANLFTDTRWEMAFDAFDVGVT